MIHLQLLQGLLVFIFVQKPFLVLLLQLLLLLLPKLRLRH